MTWNSAMKNFELLFTVLWLLSYGSWSHSCRRVQPDGVMMQDAVPVSGERGEPSSFVRSLKKRQSRTNQHPTKTTRDRWDWCIDHRPCSDDSFNRVVVRDKASWSQSSFALLIPPTNSSWVKHDQSNHTIEKLLHARGGLSLVLVVLPSLFYGSDNMLENI